MLLIQKKSLQHVSATLKSFDTYNIYKAITTALTEAGIDDSVIKKIVDKYQLIMEEERKKVSLAKDWIDALINDVEQPK